MLHLPGELCGDLEDPKMNLLPWVPASSLQPEDLSDKHVVTRLAGIHNQIGLVHQTDRKRGESWSVEGVSKTQEAVRVHHGRLVVRERAFELGAPRRAGQVG